MTIDEITKEILSINKNDYPPPLWVQNGLIRFTTEERTQIPKSIRKRFSKTRYVACYKKYINSDGVLMYEVRYHIDGQTVKASAYTLADAKQAFIQELRTTYKTHKVSI